MVNLKISINKSAVLSMILLGLLMASAFLIQVPTATAQVDTHGGPPGGGYEGPTTVPSGADSRLHY